MASNDERFVEIYESYFRHVHAYCRRRTGPDRADDAAAETFLVVWRKIDHIPDGPQILPWLYRTAYGVIRNVWRGASRRKRLDLKLGALGVDPVVPPEDFMVLRHETQQILAALSAMKPADQEVLRLSIWEDLSNPELAVTLNVSEEAARQRLSRARRKLAAGYNRLDAKGWTLPVAQKGGVQ
jgi:RNA polymerase sigma-70 factor (ECF subfamily)